MNRPSPCGVVDDRSHRRRPRSAQIADDVPRRDFGGSPPTQHEHRVGTAGSRPTSRYTAKPAIEMTNANPSRVKMIERRAMRLPPLQYMPSSILARIEAGIRRARRRTTRSGDSGLHSSSFAEDYIASSSSVRGYKLPGARLDWLKEPWWISNVNCRPKMHRRDRPGHPDPRLATRPGRNVRPPAARTPRRVCACQLKSSTWSRPCATTHWPLASPEASSKPGVTPP